MRCSHQQQHWPNLGYFLYWYLSSISWPTSKTSGLFSILYRKSIAWVFIFSDSGTFDADSKGQTICSFYYPALGAWLGKCQEAKLSLLDAKHWNWTELEMSLVWAWLLHQLQVRWSCEHISCRFYSRTQTPHWLCNMSFIFSFCRKFCGVECGHPKSIFFSLSEKKVWWMEWDIFNVSQFCNHHQWTEHPELIFPSCVPVICPQIELTPSASPNLSRDKVTLETFRQLTTPQIGTWVKTIKTPNIQAEKKKIPRDRRRETCFVLNWHKQ